MARTCGDVVTAARTVSGAGRRSVTTTTGVQGSSASSVSAAGCTVTSVTTLPTTRRVVSCVAAPRRAANRPATRPPPAPPPPSAAHVLAWYRLPWSRVEAALYPAGPGGARPVRGKSCTKTAAPRHYYLKPTSPRRKRGVLYPAL